MKNIKFLILLLILTGCSQYINLQPSNEKIEKMTQAEAFGFLNNQIIVWLPAYFGNNKDYSVKFSENKMSIFYSHHYEEYSRTRIVYYSIRQEKEVFYSSIDKIEIKYSSNSGNTGACFFKLFDTENNKICFLYYNGKDIEKCKSAILTLFTNLYIPD